VAEGDAGAAAREALSLALVRQALRSGANFSAVCFPYWSNPIWVAIEAREHNSGACLTKLPSPGGSFVEAKGHLVRWFRGDLFNANPTRCLRERV